MDVDVARGGASDVSHATTSSRATQGVLDGINPDFLNGQSRFGKAFYVAEKPQTALAELAHHNATPTHGIRLRPLPPPMALPGPALPPVAGAPPVDTEGPPLPWVWPTVALPPVPSLARPPPPGAPPVADASALPGAASVAPPLPSPPISFGEHADAAQPIKQPMKMRRIMGSPIR